MKLTGAEVMVKCLQAEGVSTIFGYPGGAILPFYDALRDETSIRHILTAHEQGAAHAADGYARASGTVGVCCATSGPGATNLVTGLANAFLDSIPVVAITGQVKRSTIGHDAFQEVDICGITMPITKQNFLVNKPEELEQTMHLAFQIARSGRPGPVLIDVPNDVQKAMIEYQGKKLPALSPKAPDPMRIDLAIDALSKAKRPVMLVGGGVAISGAQYEAVHLAEKLNLPCASTLMGLGCISSYRKQYLGMAGLHGHERANRALAEADVILALGSRFNDRETGDRATYSQGKTIIHVDIDPAEFHKNIDSRIHIAGDMRTIINMLERGSSPHDISAWWDKILTWPSMDEDYGDNTAPLFIQALNPLLKGKDYLCATDVGQHQMFTAQFIEITEKKKLLMSGGLGTMGYGMPGAIGAKIGNPDTPVISISGDGGFQMNSQELATAVLEELPIISCIFNNNNLGMVRQWQKLFYGKRYSMTCLRSGAACRGKCGEVECPVYTPDFMKLADAYGAKGIHITKKEEIEPAFREAMKSTKTPYILEFDIDPEDLVYPMVKPGGTLEDLIMDC